MVSARSTVTAVSIGAPEWSMPRTRSVSRGSSGSGRTRYSRCALSTTGDILDLRFDGKLAAIPLVANLCRHDKGFLQWAPPAWHCISANSALADAYVPIIRWSSWAARWADRDDLLGVVGSCARCRDDSRQCA